MHSAHIYTVHTQFTISGYVFPVMFLPQFSESHSLWIFFFSFYFSCSICVSVCLDLFDIACHLTVAVFLHPFVVYLFFLIILFSLFLIWLVFFSSSLVCVFICFVCDYEWIYHSFAPRNALDICSMLHLIIIIINIIKSTPFQSRRRCQWKKERWL